MRQVFRLLIAVALLMATQLAPAADFMAADQAFVPSARQLDTDHVAVTWQIADGYYLYRHGFDFALVGADKQTDESGFGPPDIPAGSKHDDPYFGAVETYGHSVRVVIPVRADSAEPTQIKVSYQGCADAGLCYPPQTKTLTIEPSGGVETAPPPQNTGADTAPVATSKVNTHTDNSPKAHADPPTGPAAEPDQLAAKLSRGNTALTLGLFLLLGIGLAFTPCILPMIPIVSALVIGSHGEAAVSRRRAFMLSSAYVVAMAAAYTVFGVIAGYFGANLQALLQQPIVLIPFAVLFVVLAAASFGWFELQLPPRWQGALGGIGADRGGMVGAAIMGFLAALIAGPCLAPPLAGALLFIAGSGSLWLGGAALFMLGLGMGLPLIVIAVFGAQLLPRRGVWMEEVRVASGIVLLGVALWFGLRLAEAHWALAGWGLLALLYGAYLSTRASTGTAATVLRRAALGVLFGYAVIAGIGLAIGGGRPAAPLAGLQSSLGSSATSTAKPDDSESPFTRITTRAQLSHALAQARAAHRPAVVDFYADWCVECVQMAHDLFPQPAVRQALAKVAAIQVDVTNYNAEARALMRERHVFGPPTLLFYRADDSLKHPTRVVGRVDAATLLRQLQATTADN